MAIAAWTHAASPEAAAEHAFDVLRREGLAGFASVFSDETCARIRGIVELAVREMVDQGSIAEVCAFVDVNNLKELTRLSDGEFVAAIFRGLQAQVAGWELLQSARPRFLGHVSDDMDRKHVVYEFLLPRLNIVSLELVPSEWRLILPVNWNMRLEEASGRSKVQLRQAWEQRQWNIVPVGHFAIDEHSAALVFRIDFECPLFGTQEFKAVRMEMQQPFWSRYASGDSAELIRHLEERIIPMSELSAEIKLLRGKF